MAECSTEPLREKLLRAFFPRIKRQVKRMDLEIKDPLERFEVAIMEAAKQQLKEREDLGHQAS